MIKIKEILDKKYQLSVWEILYFENKKRFKILIFKIFSLRSSTTKYKSKLYNLFVILNLKIYLVFFH